jgi:hypothetical protein
MSRAWAILEDLARIKPVLLCVALPDGLPANSKPPGHLLVGNPEPLHMLFDVVMEARALAYLCYHAGNYMGGGAKSLFPSRQQDA